MNSDGSEPPGSESPYDESEADFATPGCRFLLTGTVFWWRVGAWSKVHGHDQLLDFIEVFRLNLNTYMKKFLYFLNLPFLNGSIYIS
jgi:hypothetical protein